MQFFSLGYFLSVILFQFCFTSLSFCHSSDELYNIFDLSNVSEGQKTKLETLMKDLDQNLVGSKLIKKIREELKKKSKTFFVKEDTANLFQTKEEDQDSPLILGINFDGLDNLVKVGTFNDCEASDDIDPELKISYKVGVMSYPFYIVIGHELIHALHYLEDPKLYFSYKKDFDDTLWKVYGSETLSRGKKLWDTLEEQRTVIGTKDGVLGEEFSEFSLLYAAGICPRYAYQVPGKCFYELTSVMEEMFFSKLSKLGTSYIGFEKFECNNWVFNQTEAKTSNLNPQSYQDTYKDVYDEVSKNEQNQMNNQVIGASKEQEKKKQALLEKLNNRRNNFNKNKQ